MLLMIKRSLSQEQCNNYPVVHGGYRSTYFGDGDTSNLNIWSILSVNYHGADVMTNGDFVVGYYSIIE